MADEKAAPKADNNKRLAFLEDRVIFLVSGMEAAGFGIGENEDPFAAALTELERLGRIDLEHATLTAFLNDKGVSVVEGETAVYRALRKLQELEQADNAVMLAARQMGEDGVRVRDAVTALVTLVAPSTELAPATDETELEHGLRLLAGVQDQLVGLRETFNRQDGGEDVNDVIEDRVAALEEENRTLTEDKAALETKLAKIDKASGAKPRAGSRQVKAREVGGEQRGSDKSREFTGEALAQAMDSDEELELVFSNGGREIIEFEPVLVRGAAFDRQGSGRYLLRGALTLRGAGSELMVRGVGLMRNGEQVAWCAFPRPVPVPIGGERKFDRMIAFA